MSILIKGMEKPISCDDCIVPLSKCDFLQVRADKCTLIEIVECKDCIHRDPEDKKCDCGQMERQGCIFPVADDYFCKYGERRADE